MQLGESYVVAEWRINYTALVLRLAGLLSIFNVSGDNALMDTASIYTVQKHWGICKCLFSQLKIAMAKVYISEKDNTGHQHLSYVSSLLVLSVLRCADERKQMVHPKQ